MGSKKNRTFAVYFIGPGRTAKIGVGSTHIRTIYKGDTIPQRNNFFEYEEVGVGKGGHKHVKNPNFKEQLRFVMERPERFKVDVKGMGSRWNKGKEAKEMRAARLAAGKVSKAVQAQEKKAEEAREKLLKNAE